ncbi:hypothetical protein ITI46_29880 [Streptomyces oryzae]|uniref:Secreted protein n=1 Tax=Streptomyces oryzae TaxID=1434886 RepID=A0ABS3XK97_9ACTN|nr:hypothetical protein [Streptomyces oryzae]
MANLIPQFVRWLLQLLLPAPGRHRSAEIQPCADTPMVRPSPALLARAWVSRGVEVPKFDLVRPYVVAHERERQREAIGGSLEAVVM